MKRKKEIPVYLICGFLDAGKTEFLKSVLTPDGLADGSRTLLFQCEEGEEEYDEAELKKRNVVLIPIEGQEQLTTQLLLDCERKYRPEQVLFEYNGMWSMEELDREILPEHWVLYQIVHVVESPTFQMYAQNMASLMMEKLRNADMIIFNRCNDELKEVLRRRNIKMLNRRAAIYLEFEDGTTEDYDSGVPPLRHERRGAGAGRRRLRHLVHRCPGAPRPVRGEEGALPGDGGPLGQIPRRQLRSRPVRYGVLRPGHHFPGDDLLLPRCGEGEHPRLGLGHRPGAPGVCRALSLGRPGASHLVGGARRPSRGRTGLFLKKERRRRGPAGPRRCAFPHDARNS